MCVLCNAFRMVDAVLINVRVSQRGTELTEDKDRNQGMIIEAVPRGPH